MINRCVLLATTLAIGLLLAGCYTDFGPIAGEPAPLPPPSAASVLALGERVTVTVYDEPNLSGVYDVDPAGYLNLPLIGRVKAAGLTPSKLQDNIARLYESGKFLAAPKVTVTIVEYQPIYIFGEVAKPGQYAYRSGLNAIAVVAEAGGLTYRGNRSSILIQHPGQKAWTEYPLLASVTILPGDLIRVPERFY